MVKIGLSHFIKNTDWCSLKTVDEEVLAVNASTSTGGRSIVRETVFSGHQTLAS